MAKKKKLKVKSAESTVREMMESQDETRQRRENAPDVRDFIVDKTAEFDRSNLSPAELREDTLRARAKRIPVKSGETVEKAAKRMLKKKKKKARKRERK